MKVEELIKILKKVPAESDVIINTEDRYGDLVADSIGIVSNACDFNENLKTDEYVILVGDSYCYIEGDEDE